MFPFKPSLFSHPLEVPTKSLLQTASKEGSIACFWWMDGRLTLQVLWLEIRLVHGRNPITTTWVVLKPCKSCRFPLPTSLNWWVELIPDFERLNHQPVQIPTAAHQRTKRWPEPWLLHLNHGDVGQFVWLWWIDLSAKNIRSRKWTNVPPKKGPFSKGTDPLPTTIFQLNMGRFRGSFNAKTKRWALSSYPTSAKFIQGFFNRYGL